MSEVITPIAEGAKPPVETAQPMSEGDFLSRRIAKLTGTPPPAPAAEAKPTEPESVPEATPVATESPSTEGTPPPQEKPKADVLSKELDDMSEDELRELAAKLGSKAVARYGELTYKRKAAEEQLMALKAEILRSQQQQAPEPRVENNPYADISTIEKLSEEKEKLIEAVDWYEEVLFKSDDFGANDIVATVQGKEVTKADVRAALHQARKARDRYLPAQERELQARAQRVQQEEMFRQHARKELAWLNGEDNDTRKQYEAMVKDPRLGKLKEKVPELAPQIEYIIAHAANSMFTRREVESFASNKPTLTPPATPKSSAAAPERADARTEKNIKDVQARFQQTGTGSDFIALRAAQLSKRR